MVQGFLNGKNKAMVGSIAAYIDFVLKTLVLKKIFLLF